MQTSNRRHLCFDGARESEPRIKLHKISYQTFCSLRVVCRASHGCVSGELRGDGATQKHDLSISGPRTGTCATRNNFSINFIEAIMTAKSLRWPSSEKEAGLQRSVCVCVLSRRRPQE